MYHGVLMHPLDSARERLKRANENIRNLNSEVNVFLDPFPRISWKGDNSVFTDADQHAFNVLRENALKNNTLPRFSVLAGEIVHHLRCAFDHIIWQLSTLEARARFATDIEFPVCDSRPKVCKWAPDKVKHSRYCGKVKGVASITALTRIDGLQPYNRTDPHNSPLLLIHNLDRFAKHRELNVVIVNIGMSLQGRGLQGFRAVKDSATGGFQILGPAGPPQMEMYGELSAQIMFAEFSERKGDPLIKFLNDLARFTSDSIEAFAVEFP